MGEGEERVVRKREGKPDKKGKKIESRRKGDREGEEEEEGGSEGT